MEMDFADFLIALKGGRTKFRNMTIFSSQRGEETVVDKLTLGVEKLSLSAPLDFTDSTFEIDFWLYDITAPAIILDRVTGAKVGIGRVQTETISATSARFNRFWVGAGAQVKTIDLSHTQVETAVGIDLVANGLRRVEVANLVCPQIILDELADRCLTGTNRIGKFSKSQYARPKVPLHEVVRPRGNRDEAGVLGESLHALADWIERYHKAVTVSDAVDKRTLFATIKALAPPRDKVLNLNRALDRLAEMAGMVTA